jgi:hypothetical protein
VDFFKKEEKESMQQIEVKQQIASNSGEVNAAIAKPPESSGSAVSPPLPESTAAGGETPCAKSGCGGAKLNGARTYPYVFVLGRINARFSTMAAEKEFAQATARAGKEMAGLTNQKAFHALLSDRNNRYLVRQLCWVLTIEGVDTYILQPRDPADFDLLVEATRPAPSPMDIDVVIGVRGPIASPQMCNGLMVPIVAFDQIYSFDRDSFLEALKEKRPETMSEEEFTGAAKELLDRIMQLSDNAGATDEHRALNYLAVRYELIYVKATEMHQRNFALTEVIVGTSRLSGTRKIVAPIFFFTHRETGFVEKYFVRVDVTEMFPFLVTPLSPYYDR